MTASTRKGFVLDVAAFAVAGFLSATGFAADGVVTYEEFGAVGDGTHDDLPAIVAAHAAANEKGLPVRAKDEAIYYIGPSNLTGVIRTDTDFGQATFFIDDTCGVSNRMAAIFSVPQPVPTVKFKVEGPVPRTRKSLGVKLPGRCFVMLFDANRRQYMRDHPQAADKGAPQTELLLVEADGAISPKTPVSQDMATVTSAEAYPISPTRLTIRGGRFIHLCNREEGDRPGHWQWPRYYCRGISLSRSNTLIEGVDHRVLAQKDYCFPYASFVSVNNAALVTVKDMMFWAHRKCGHGTYDFTVGRALGIRFIRCKQRNDIHDDGNWPPFGINYGRLVTFDDCETVRFDAHAGVRDAVIRNSRLRIVNIIGGGNLMIENSRIESGWAAIWMRDDYGSVWNGDITVRNCTIAPWEKGQDTRLFAANNPGTHDFGYPCHMGRRITLENVRFEDVGRGEMVLFGISPDDGKRAKDAPFPYLPPEEVVIRNVTSASGREPKLTNAPEFLKGTKVTRQ